MRHAIILIVLSLMVLLTSCSSQLLPQSLASDTQATVEDVKQSSDDVFAEIQQNLSMVSELKDKIQKAQMEGKPISLNDVIRDIEKVSNSYSKLASQKDDIKKSILQKINNVIKMRAAIDVEINALRQKKEAYNEQLRGINDKNPEIAKTRTEALTKAIKFTDAQINLWLEFDRLEKGIVIDMTAIENKIDSFLSMIDSTALVFKEGLNLLQLQQSISEALALFTNDLPQMERLTDEMRQSWEHLDYLVESLSTLTTNMEAIK